MPFRTWVYAVAFGLIAGLGQAQQSASPAFEGQPVTEAGDEQSAAEASDRSEDQSGDTVDVPSALQGIKAAIRELVTEEDKVERERQDQREIRDLHAQEAMARWAKVMTWATVASVIVTAVGIVLVGWTLHHTRRAANYAGAMVSEAEKATMAAQDAVAETRRIGEAQVRAYLVVENVTVTARPEGHLLFWDIDVTIHNCGQSPAERIEMKVTVFNGQTPFASGLSRNLSASKSCTIFAICSMQINNLSRGDDGKVFFISSIEITYRDVFLTGEDRRTTRIEAVGNAEMGTGEKTDLSLVDTPHVPVLKCDCDD